MSTAPRDPSPAGKVFEHSLLSTDAARALRSSVAMAAAWVVCLLAGHPEAVLVAAPAAQNVAILDVRGDYRARLVILLCLVTLLAFAALAGTLSGNHVTTATLMIGVMALLAGCWRHLSGDYGPHFALGSGLLFLLALSNPGGGTHAWSMLVATALGGLGGVLAQLSGWFVRPQHALRHAVAEAWVAASDLIAAMREETDDGRVCSSKVAEKEGALRATVDQTLRVITTTASGTEGDFAGHLDDATQLAARLATRTTALRTALEAVEGRPEFAAVAPALDSALRSLSSALRSGALTLITHRAGQLLALEVRLRRAGDLLQVLDTRLAALHPADAELTQARQMLALLAALLPTVRETLGATVDHGAPQAGFALRLPELGGMSMRSLGAWLNPAAQLDWVLVRYTLRVAAVLMLAVAIYKGFNIPRGHWIGFTVLIVLQPDYGATRRKLGQRLAGTLAGVALGSLLLWLRMPVAAFVLCASAMAFCFGYFLRRHYGLAVFFVTLMVVLMSEAAMPVHLDFTAARLFATVAGGALALVAALVFWPQWERAQSPSILAAALRANRGYLEAVAANFERGDRFVGDAVLTKREAERANSRAAASLQRWLGEPSRLRADTGRIAALTTYSQRLTRAISVLAQHLNQRAGRPFTGAGQTIASMGGALETLAHHLADGTPSPERPALTVAAPVGTPEGDVVVYRQLARIVTEIDALALAARDHSD